MDDDDFDYDELERIEQQLLAGRQGPAGPNPQSCAPPQSYQAYQAPGGVAPGHHGAGYPPPAQQPWNQAGPPAVWAPPAAPPQQQQPQWPAAQPSAYGAPGYQQKQQYQQPQQGYHAPQGYGGGGAQQQLPPPASHGKPWAPPPQQQPHFPAAPQPSGWQQPAPAGYHPPPQPQPQWQAPAPVQQPNAAGGGYGYGGNGNNSAAWQPQTRPAAWQPDSWAAPAQPPAQQPAQPAAAPAGFQQHPPPRQPPLGNVPRRTGGGQKAQRDLRTLWDLPAPPKGPPPRPAGRFNAFAASRSEFRPPSPPPPANPAATGELASCETTTGALRVCPGAAAHWVYPLGVPERAYQTSAMETALLCNTLVCLPTGLGKTLIAAVVMHNYARWFPESKIVFLAPTKPLVAQQIDACRRFMGLAPSAAAELTGHVKPDERKELWRDPEKRVFFCTPQTLYNDVKKAICPYDTVSCLVIDECHRATGQSEIAQTLLLMRNRYRLKFRVLGLSATPGSDGDRVQEVIRNLGISAVHFRAENDEDVAPYVHKKITQLEIVGEGNEGHGRGPRPALGQALMTALEALARSGAWQGPVNPDRVSRHALTQALNAARDTAAAGTAPAPSAETQRLFRAAAVMADLSALLEQRSAVAASELLCRQLDEDQAFKEYYNSDAGLQAFGEALDAAAAEGGGGLRMARLVSLLRRHFEADGDPGGVIVFASVREQVGAIVDALRRHEPLIRALAFIGQGSGGGGASGSGARRRGGEKGMNQREQKAAIKSFASGVHNVLVATCVGEEGLDIPAVDLIICYDATASPTRAVQRRGRTGRFREGKVVYILAAGREEARYREAVAHAEELHQRLRNAAGSFDLGPPVPRMLPRIYNPTRMDEWPEGAEAVALDEGDSGGGGDGEVAALGMERGGRGRGGAGGTRGRGRGHGRAAAAAAAPAGAVDEGDIQIAGARPPGVMAMLEAGAARMAKEGRRYPVQPVSPPPSQPFATQLDSHAPPHRLLFSPSSAFIRPGSNGRRLAIAPPPRLEELLSAAPGGADPPAPRVPEPLPPRRALPELEDNSHTLTLPCGIVLAPGSGGSGSGGDRGSGQPAWSFLAAAIAKPPQPDVSLGAVAVGGRKRKTTAGRGRGRGRRAAPPARVPTPAAVLALAGADEVPRQLNAVEQRRNEDEDMVELVEERPAPPAAAPATGADGPGPAVDVINLVSSDDEEEAMQVEKEQAGDPRGDVAMGDADKGGTVIGGGSAGDPMDDFYCVEDEMCGGDDDCMIESTSQMPLAERLAQRAPAPAAAPAPAPARKQTLQMEPDDELDVPLAKRARLLRTQGTASPGSAVKFGAPSAGPSRPSRLGLPATGAGSLRVPSGPQSVPHPSSGGGSVGGSGVDDWAGAAFDDAGDLFGDCMEHDELWEEWQDGNVGGSGAGSGAGPRAVPLPAPAPAPDPGSGNAPASGNAWTKPRFSASAVPQPAPAAAAAPPPPPGLPSDLQDLEDDSQQAVPAPGVPRRRAIITSQSPRPTPQQPVGAASGPPLAVLEDSPSIVRNTSSTASDRVPSPPRPARLNRLRKAGQLLPGAGGGNGNGGGRGEEDVPLARLRDQLKAARARPPAPKPSRSRQLAVAAAAARRFLDAEAALSGDEEGGSDEDDEVLDAYESDFIDDGTPAGGSHSGPAETPGDPGSSGAPFPRRRLPGDHVSPSPGEILRRLQLARMGRGRAAGGATPMGPPPGFGALPGGASDDYDLEDSFIDDGEGDDGFDTPQGRASHDDACGVCGGGDGELLLCDICPCAFHLRCLGLAVVPLGDWVCGMCREGVTPGSGRSGGPVPATATAMPRSRPPMSRPPALPKPPQLQVHPMAPPAMHQARTQPAMAPVPTATAAPAAAAPAPAAAGPPPPTHNLRVMGDESDDEFM